MIRHSEVSDDFTFPTIADHNSLCHFRFPEFSSSPFWFVTKATPAVAGPELRRRKSFSAAEGNRLRIDDALQGRANSTLSDAAGESFLDAEEKMDMLWEDLNEELGGDTAGRRSSLACEPDFSTIPESDRAHMEDLSRVKALKISKRGSMAPRGRANLLVVFKVFKKLLLLHSPGYHKKV